MNKSTFILQFLRDVSANNNKDWMEQNKARYEKAKQYWLDEVTSIIERLATHDDYFKTIEPKKTIMRFNNNRMFNKDLPLYKDHFSFSPMNKEDKYSKIFFSFGAETTLIGGGAYKPQKEILEEIRNTIDKTGNQLEEAVNNLKFKEFYGGLSVDSEELKNVPKGFDKEHTHGYLLKRKSITGLIEINTETLLERNLTDFVEEAFLALLPLSTYFKNNLN